MKFKKKEGHELRWYEIRLGEVFISDDICIKVEKKETKDGFIFNAIGLTDGGFQYMPEDEKYEVLKDCYLAY